ncbi:MAG: hypothetical protein VXZ40_00380 [Nanoarchaeota archaeon]|nr:hypothetical protein [Nanoarchaeota archaeon]
MSLTLLLGSYLTSLLGFSLGKSTQEEHHEIKTKALLCSYLLQIVATLSIILSQNYILIGIGLLSLINIAIGYFKYHPILEFNAVIVFSTLVFAYVTTELFFLMILPLISLIIENSFKSYHRKEELYKLGIVLLLGILLF